MKNPMNVIEAIGLHNLTKSSILHLLSCDAPVTVREKIKPEVKSDA
jgi:hypothetical protein